MKCHRPFLVFAALAFGLVSAGSAAVETYTIDPVHSSVGFSVRHFVSKVTGKFTDFSGSISLDQEHPEKSSAEATIKIASVNTNTERRDNHLRSADFFDAAKYPTMTFKSTSWSKTGAETFEVTGDLTIKDVTKPVVLKVTLLGIGPGGRGTQLSGWEATTTINKADYNVKDPPMLDAAIGDDVTITINVEAGLKKT